MITCSLCRKDNQDHYRFCLGCGNELPRGAAAPAKPAAPEPAAPNPVPVAPFVAPAVVSAQPNPFQEPGPPKPADPSPPIAPIVSSATPNPFAPQAPMGAPMPCLSPARPEQIAQPARFKLIHVRPDGTEGDSFQLKEGQNVIGRNTAPVFSTDTYLNPNHATFMASGTTIKVRNDDPANIVFVRIDRQVPAELRDGDTFRIGQQILRFEANASVYPPPVEGASGKLSLVVGFSPNGNSFPIPPGGFSLGRERGDVNFPEDGYVSGLHCRVGFENGKLFITDVGSSNGTYLGIRGERILRPNDLLLLGTQVFRVHLQ